MIKIREKYISLWFICCSHLETRRRVFSTWWNQWWMIKKWSENVEHERRLFIINFNSKCLFVYLFHVFSFTHFLVYISLNQINVVYLFYLISFSFISHRHLISSSSHLIVNSSHLSYHLILFHSMNSSNLVLVKIFDKKTAIKMISVKMISIKIASIKKISVKRDKKVSVKKANNRTIIEAKRISDKRIILSVEDEKMSNFWWSFVNLN
jgi:hypothetical protein